MTGWFLTLDVGTTSVKAAAITETGQALASARAGYATQRPRPSWVEQDPTHWWRASSEAIAALLDHDAVVVKGLRAIGLSGMAATHVLLDAAGSILRPAILWQDTRATLEADELRRSLGEERIRHAFGADLALTASAQAARMLWLARHESDTWTRTHTILGAKDFLAWCLTGERATDRTSISGFANLRDGSLEGSIASATLSTPAMLPRLVEPHEIMGVVSPRAAAATGVPAGTPVAMGMMDSWCAMLGSGVGRPGDAFDTAGTAEVVGLAGTTGTGRQPEAAIYRLPFLTNVDVVYGVTQCGTDALSWYTETFAPVREHDTGHLSTQRDTYGSLNDRAATVAPGSDGLLFLPYLEGERSPFNDPDARGAFLGMQRRHSEAHFARAVLEGVAFSVRHVLEACERETTLHAERIVVAGGGASSRLWNQIKADVTGRPFVAPAVLDAGTVGAAILARAAVEGLEASAAAEGMLTFDTSIEPDAHRSRLYDATYHQYLAASDAVSDVHHGLVHTTRGTGAA